MAKKEDSTYGDLSDDEKINIYDKLNNGEA
jgi:hypothetical protein